MIETTKTLICTDMVRTGSQRVQKTPKAMLVYNSGIPSRIIFQSKKNITKLYSLIAKSPEAFQDFVGYHDRDKFNTSFENKNRSNWAATSHYGVKNSAFK